MIRINFDHGPELSLLPVVPEKEAVSSTESPRAPVSIPVGKVSSDVPTQDSLSDEQEELLDDLFTPEIKTMQENRLRKCQEIGAVLKQFTRNIKAESRPPKLENLRYRVMRSLKKFIRRLLQDKEVSKKGLMAIKGDLDHFSLSEIKSYCERHRQALTDFSSLQNGPCVDHRRSGMKTGHNTYNNNYMREIFRQEEVRETYTRYIQLLFTKDQPDSLCHRFKIQCCPTSLHDQVCSKKWLEFKNILLDFLGADVEMTRAKEEF